MTLENLIELTDIRCIELRNIYTNKFVTREPHDLITIYKDVKIGYITPCLSSDGLYRTNYNCKLRVFGADEDIRKVNKECKDLD